ncbi:MAG: hypothetical protein ABI467_06520 [Kofleriaceae bacterium]
MASTKIVQARLDAKTARLLGRLRRTTGMSDSDLVRQGLELVAQQRQPLPARKIYGLGAFESGIPDLGSNKGHLAGFGRS